MLFPRLIKHETSRTRTKVSKYSSTCS